MSAPIARTRHRLMSTMPNGERWSSPRSGVVFIAANGDIDHVDHGTLGSTGRHVDTGATWQTVDGDE